MPQVWDAETEALRRELTQLSPKELLALAHQEGVRTAGRAAADIVEALLKMDCDADAAGKECLYHSAWVHPAVMMLAHPCWCCCMLTRCFVMCFCSISAKARSWTVGKPQCQFSCAQYYTIYKNKVTITGS
jgi:hypothetical protein